MKLWILLLVAFAAIAQAQEPTSCLKLNHLEVEQHSLHQNQETYVELTFEGTGCRVLSESEGGQARWPKLDIKSASDVTIKVKTAEALQFDQNHILLRARVSLTTSREAALGEHLLPGIVHYKVWNEAGNVVNENLSFHIPVNIVKLPPPRFAERHRILAAILLEIELVAIWPLWIVSNIIGGGGC